MDDSSPPPPPPPEAQPPPPPPPVLKWTQGDKRGTCVATNVRGLCEALKNGGATVSTMELMIACFRWAAALSIRQMAKRLRTAAEAAARSVTRPLEPR